MYVLTMQEGPFTSISINKATKIMEPTLRPHVDDFLSQLVDDYFISRKKDQDHE